MTNTKKQLKITKLFRKGAQLPDDCIEVQEEIQQLELQLKEKQDELFQIQRNSFRRNAAVSSAKSKPEPFVRPNKIILNNSVESLKRNLNLISMLTGMEVQSYEVEDHCCIVYHLQHKSQHEVKHGLKIDLKSGLNHVSSSSLPLGFNLSGVLEDFDDVMKPACLGAIRNALVAYYDRLEQYEALKNLLNVEARMSKILDGSHMEVTFTVCSQDEEQMRVVLILDYRVYDVRPKLYAFKESDLPEGASEILEQQCAVFKKKSLVRAFKDAFINGHGPFKLLQQICTRPVEKQRRRKHKRFRPNMHYNMDDTFLPEDTDPSDDDEHI